MAESGGLKIRVRLEAYDVKVLDTTVRNIIDAVKKSGASVNGPIMLPTKRRVWAVNRSPHIYKTSQEHFEMRIHRRLLVITDPNTQTIDLLKNLQVPAGVSVVLK